MQCNAAEIWLNAMYVNALIFSQIYLKIKKKINALTIKARTLIARALKS